VEIKSVKYHLHRVVGDTLLTYEEMTTFLSQVEAVLNSRPLCPLTEDPDDLNVLMTLSTSCWVVLHCSGTFT